MPRKKGSNGQRLDNVEKEVQKLKEEYENHKEEYENYKKEYQQHINMHVIDDLRKTRYGEKPLYSYQDIADRYNISKSTVQRIALNEGIRRRKKA